MFAPIPSVLDDLRSGKMVILTDDENRENEGDLVLPAQFVTPEAITFLLSVARGYLCLSLSESDCDRLHLHPQAPVNNTARGTAFTVSIDLHPRFGTTTGVSARERAACIRHAIDPASKPDDFVRPGHINPLRSRTGGVLVRTGQTEGSLDLCRLAGLYPAALIIEIMRDDGEMARLPDLQRLASLHNLKLCSVAQIIQHRLERESLVRRLPPTAGTPIRTRFGSFNLLAFESLVDPLPHIALTLGGVGDLDPAGHPIPHPEPTLVRMHRRNLLGDIFADLDASPEGPTADTLHASMRAIQAAGRGALIYLRPEGVPLDAAHATHADLEQRLRLIRRPDFDPGSDDPNLAHPDRHAVPASLRDFGVGGQILRALGLSNLRLLTNHARPLPGLEAFGLRVVEHVPVPPLAP
ncbi:MAG: 3,4-dihydroxy-2-butanone-4-phosphate synthase [Phycisphaerae bacterium]|nr:3,4-dihydroxy-2-butanone-4-phosphate synthase [Phycisphaerae bacterium]